MNRLFWKHFLQALGTLASIATLIAFVSQWNASNINCCETLLLGVAILTICYLYADYQMVPKESVCLDFSNFRIKLSFGDIFRKKGIIVIPVNEYFDTQVDDIIIAHKTLHGQFIDRYFDGKTDELDNLIEKQLEGVSHEKVDARASIKSLRYPIGTCVDICNGDNVYVLFALTHFNDKNVAYLERKEFGDAVCSLMQHLHDMNNDRPVYMPLFGTGMSKMQRSHQRVLTFILDWLDFTNAFSIPAGLNIVIYNGDRDKVNLTLVEEYFDGALSK